MAKSESNQKGDKPYTVPPTSQVDAERRLEDDYVPDSALGTTVVNPNPFGAEDYAGTDPIYQNHANKTEAPLAAKEGADKKAEQHVKSLHETKGETTTFDYGMGGEAVVADPNGGAGPSIYLVPGQEGYDKSKAEEQSGPPMRVEDDEDKKGGHVKAPPPPDPDDPTGAAHSGSQKDPK